MRSTLLFLALLLASFSLGCGQPDVAHDPALVETLAKLHLLDARDDEFGDVTDAVRDSVLLAHGFTPEGFRLQVDRLISQPEQAESVFARVQDRLTAWSLPPSPRDSLSR